MTKINNLESRRTILPVIAVLVGLAGVAALALTQAATFVIQSEAETGSVAGAAAVVDADGASSGRAVHFGSGPAVSQIYLGAAIEPGQLDNASFSGALKRYKFDSLTAENVMKFGRLEPNRNQFDWATSDKVVNFAQANGMRVRGHTLAWHVEVPGWVGGLSSADAESALRNHITQIMQRYRGKVVSWDVVNEALNDDGSVRNSVWSQKLGNDWIAKAFQMARQADSTAKLCYNDFSAESRDLDGNGGTGRAAKSDAVYNMVKDFKQRGVPIDCVGFQTHSAGQYPGTETALRENMTRLKDAGVTVEITELDVINIGDETAKANRYAVIGRACKAAGNCTGVTTWGLYDGHTWRGSSAGPLTLDTNFNAKPSYFALTSAIGHPAGN